MSDTAQVTELHPAEGRLELALAGALDRINATKDMASVYKDLGMEQPKAITEATWSRVEAVELATFHAPPTWAAQRGIGVPGTYLSGGRIQVEQNSRLKPYQARGSVSKPGTNEQTYRREPVVFESVNQLATLVCAANYEPHIPDELPTEVQDEVKRQHRAIRYAMMRDDFLGNASSFIKHGFAFFEVRWNLENPTPAHLEFREQSTVHRWLFDERQSQWLGTEFRVGGDASGEGNYTIPNGRTIRSARSLLINLHAQGNNLEGVSPVRVAHGMSMLKKAILQMAGVGLQKYMVPIAVIAHELINATSQFVGELGADHKAELNEFISRIEAWKGRVGGALPVPAGRKLEFANPSNEMPDVIPLLTYLDSMMGLVFSNEGATIGSQSFGSYAMSQTSLERFRASAPLYAGRVAHALTKLLHIGLELNGIDLAEHDAIPTYTFRFNGTQDASKWLADLTLVTNAMKASGPWPNDLRAAAAAKLGLPVDAFDGIEFDTPAPNPMQGEEE